MPNVAVVIVNYRSARLVHDCLKSLEPEISRMPNTRVIVVDNASGDDSVQHLDNLIRQQGWAWASVVPAPRNGGFAYGNNVAIREFLKQASPPDYIWLLNPDTIVRTGAIDPLVKFLQDRPEVGIVGGGLEDLDGTPQTGAFRFPSFLGEIEITSRIGLVSRMLARFRVPVPPDDQIIRADWVNGASMMVRREVFESTGLMDEGYFLYFEETDFCRRAQTAGWSTWFVPQSRVVHLVGQTTGVTGTERAKRRRPRYWFDSRSRYFRKHAGPTMGRLADIGFVMGMLAWRAKRLASGHPEIDPPYLLRDFVVHSLGR